VYFVYVLQSLRTGRHYVGCTSDVSRRLGQHNAGITKSTKNRGPWTLVHQEAYEVKTEAMRRDRHSVA